MNALPIRPPTKTRPITIAIVGAGSRGRVYAGFAAEHPERLRVVAVADPREAYRESMRRSHSLPDEAIFDGWRSLASRDRLADAVVIATPDAAHADPVESFAQSGYDILLEKPMAPNERDCLRIAEAAQVNDCILAVAHVLRYTDYTTTLKQILDSGVIGQVATIEHLEPVGFWHQAHSFVRGNWQRSEISSPMLLAKSCHDIDWISYLLGLKCLSVSSFGSLLHFTRANKPREAGAAQRCTSCAYERACPYSAVKIYLDRVRSGYTGWPVDILAPEITEDSIKEALETGPYGLCVYECDNDVVDHQVVALRFENEVTASFTMTGFTETGHRKSRIFGTRGMIEGNGDSIRHYDFLSEKWSEIEIQSGDSSIRGGHGGGDNALMDAFVSAVSTGDRGWIRSAAAESLATHQIVFAAERARTLRKVVDL